MAPGKIRYSLVCNEDGGILDDVLVYHLQSRGRGDYYLMVVNASNRDKIYRWLLKQRKTGEEVNIPPGKAVRFKPGKELQGKDGEKPAS